MTHARCAAALAAACFGAPTLLAAGARAAKPGPCEPTGPWVLATVRQPAPRGIDAAEVFDRLSVELATRAVTLCTRPPAAAHEGPVAEIALGGSPSASGGPKTSPRSVWIDVDVHRSGASKHAAREIDVGAVSRDSRATVVALAADELVRASSDELALGALRPTAAARAPSSGDAQSAPAPKPAVSRAPAVGPDAPFQAPSGERAAPAKRDEVEPTRGVARARLALGVRGSGEWWTGGVSLFGGDLAASVRIAPRAFVDVLAGGRASLSEEVRDGAIEVRAFCGRLGASVALTRPSSPPVLAFGARAGLCGVWMAGDPAAGAWGDERAALGVTLEAGPSLRIPFGDKAPVLVVEAAFAGAPRGVAARDGDAVVTGMTGVAFLTSMGIAGDVL